jgi:arabinogalactan oligomer / maltooligosaccharide transport system permease protein
MLQAYVEGRATLAGSLVKITVLGLVNALAVYAALLLLDAGATAGLVSVVVATVVLDAVYLSKRTVPLKYLLPGTLLLLLFQIYPVAFNTYIAFTNYGDGNILSKQQAVEQLERSSVAIPADAVRYETVVLSRPSDGAIALLLTAPDGSLLLGTAEGTEAVSPDDVEGEGAALAVGAYRRMPLGEANARQEEVLGLEVPLDEDEVISVQTFSTAARAEQDLAYDPDRDVMVRASTGTEYRPVEGRFVSDDGERLVIGWREFTGFDNFARVLTSSAIRGEFLGVFAWTLVFAISSVVTTFVLGLALAIALDDPRVRGRKLYRALLIIPYALPSFMTALIWKGLLNQQFGFVNDVLGANIPWLTSRALEGLLPKLSVLLVNTWLGFPYMFLICTGALQAIPSDLKEAAYVDGASAWAAFRRIVLPLLLVAVGPLLIASFAFNFNNFNVIFLLTGGDPPISGAATPVGHTDILISYAYRIAFAGGRGADYGLAAAISVFIFTMVALITGLSFKRTRVLEEIN